MNEQIVINSLLISYNNFGVNEQRPALLFLHGWRSSKEVWQGIVGRLISSPADQNYNIYTLDLPGFGASQAPSSLFGVGDYAQVVKEFIEKLGLKDVILIGHSFGGRVGIKLAAMTAEKRSNLAADESTSPLKGEKGNISKLVLVDSAGFAMNESKKNIYGSLAKIAKPFFSPKFMQPLRKKIYKQIGAEDYLATPQLQATFVKVTAEDLSPDLKKIVCPTLIVFGQNDTDTPVEFGEKMEQLITTSNLVVIKDAGHFSFLDKPDEFLKQLQD